MKCVLLVYLDFYVRKLKQCAQFIVYHSACFDYWHKTYVLKQRAFCKPRYNDYSTDTRHAKDNTKFKRENTYEKSQNETKNREKRKEKEGKLIAMMKTNLGWSDYERDYNDGNENKHEYQDKHNQKQKA